MSHARITRCLHYRRQQKTGNPPLAFGSRPPYQGVKGASSFLSSVLRIFPEAGHDAVGARDDLADLALRQLALGVVEDLHFAAGAREAAARELVEQRGLVQLLRQPGDGHRRLALAVELIQPLAEELDRAQ